MAIKSADASLIRAGDVNAPNLQVILGAAVPSKFGKNAETVFDEQVRKGLEIGPDVLRFALPKQPTVDQTDEVVSKISNAFAGYLHELFPRADNISLKFCKLALYKEGGHFSEHKDTAHDPNHQGTLLLEVKTAHTGGKLTFKVDDEVINWDLSQPPPFSSNCMRWCAFHTDISHQVHEVTSGVRAVLQFDIYVTHRGESGKKTKSSENLFQYTSPLVGNNELGILEQRACQRCIAELEMHTTEGAIAMPLLHAYHHAYLRPEFLKSVDRALFDALLGAGFKVLLTPVVVHCTGGGDRGYEHDIGPCDPYDRIYSAAKFKDEHGKAKVFSEPASSFKPESVKYIYTGRVQSREFFHEDFIEYTGNESQPAEMKYYSAAMVILPKPGAPGKKASPYSALLFDQASADVTLIVGGERMPAHKEVLCASSAVFLAMFQVPMKEAASSEVVVGEEYSVDTVKAMLHFIYTDAIPVPLLKAELLLLLPLAIYYQMDELKEYAEDACRAFVDVHNVHEIVQATRQHAECAALLQDILRWIADNAKLLVTTNPTFTAHLDKASMELVLKALVGLVD